MGVYFGCCKDKEASLIGLGDAFGLFEIDYVVDVENTDDIV